MTEEDAHLDPAGPTPRRGLAAGAGAAAIFLLLIAFCLVALDRSARDQLIEYPPELTLTATAGEVKVPTGLREQLLDLLRSQPLDQRLFNLFFVTETKRDVSQARRDRLVKVLGELGWRTNAAQQNLIVEAVARDDLRSAVLRADGLLRRERLTAELLPVMRVMEQEPAAAEMLIERLGKNPGWRTDYFAAVDALTDPNARVARLRLFNTMLDARMPLTREELKPSLDAIVAAGDYAPAMAVVDRLKGRVPPGARNRDPDFARMAALPAELRRTSLPSEWELVSRRGLTTRIAPAADKGNMLSIRWNGEGAPIFARQLVRVGQASSLELDVAATDLATVGRLNRLSFQFACPGRMPLIFEPEGDDDRLLAATYRLGQAPGCEYGYLVVAGQPMMVDRNLYIELASLRIAA